MSTSPSSSRSTPYGIDELLAVVRFYAHPAHHRGVGISEVYKDHGRRAREVLGECKPCYGQGLIWDDRSARDVPCRACGGSGVRP